MYFILQNKKIVGFFLEARSNSKTKCVVMDPGNNSVNHGYCG